MDDLNGELVPVGGGDPIPLVRTPMTLGRRESCDICLQFPNVSGVHCEFVFQDGYWSVRDLNSTNGVKVNGQKVPQRPLKPGDEVSIAKRRFTIQYTPSGGAGRVLDEMLSEEEDIFGKSLLEKAGLAKQIPGKDRPRDWRRMILDEE